MATPATVRREVVHGKGMTLDEETGLSDGQQAKHHGTGMRSCFGAQCRARARQG